ncbi:MAG: hypothetical protein AB7R89_03545 [Dehalococcoidia bacterium]
MSDKAMIALIIGVSLVVLVAIGGVIKGVQRLAEEDPLSFEEYLREKEAYQNAGAVWILADTGTPTNEMVGRNADFLLYAHEGVIMAIDHFVTLKVRETCKSSYETWKKQAQALREEAQASLLYRSMPVYARSRHEQEYRAAHERVLAHGREAQDLEKRERPC